MKESYVEGLGAAMLADVPVGKSPAGGTRSVATVVIPGGGDEVGRKAGYGKEQPIRLQSNW
jgi:hypothetical protein